MAATFSYRQPEEFDFMTGMNFMRIPGLGLFFLLVIAASGEAQTVGHIAGRVVALDGRPQAGVAVSATGPTLLGTRRTSTAADGRFLLPSLPVGRYSLQFAQAGMRSVLSDSVAVSLGSTASLADVVLQPAQPTQLAQVTVRASESFDATNTSARMTLSARQLDALPLERNFRGLFSLAPTATTSFFPGDGVNIAGATGLENVYYVDGINVTSPIDGATSIDLPYNFIRQTEIRTSAGAPDAGQALGGVLNVVTPSGGNSIRGDVFAFYTGRSLQADIRSNRGVADTYQYDIGGSLGGPLLRDRLWFFGAYNPVSERRSIAYDGPLGALSYDKRQQLMAFKLTGLPAARTTASVTVLADPTNEQTIGAAIPIFGQPARVLDRAAVEGEVRRRGAHLSLSAEHQLTSAVRLEASVAQSSRRETFGPRPGVEPAMTSIDYVTGEWSGGFGYTATNRGTRQALRAGATVLWREHTARAGIEYDHQDMRTQQRGSDTTAGGFLQRTEESTWVWFQFDTNGRLVSRNPAVFLRDTWEISRSVIVDAGLRWSSQQLLYDGDVRHRVKDGWQPYLSLVLATSDQSQRLFLTAARTADQLALWSLAQAHGPFVNKVVSYSHDPRIDPDGGECGCFSHESPPFGYAHDRTFAGMIQDEFAVGYQARFSHDVVFGARASSRDLVSTIEDGWFIDNWAVGNPGRGSLSGFPDAKRRYRALELSVARWTTATPRFQASYVLSKARGNYTGLYASDLAAGTPHVSAQYDFPEQLVNGTGLLPNDRTHVLKLLASHDLPLGVTLGASWSFASGVPLTDYGTASVGAPYWVFLSPRGSVGRSPSVTDLNIRLTYAVPATRFTTSPTVILDLQHVGNAQRPVGFDQVHYTAVDANGRQQGENRSWLSPTRYQPPMTARLGMQLRF